MDHNQERRRGHFHRGRRGQDRRGPDRRGPQAPPPPRDQVDVEQIMRDIRSRIAQRQGLDFSAQQIQDLAARKLESILDPRAIKPSLLEGLRRSAAAAAPAAGQKPSSEPVYAFEDTTIYDSHRGILRFVRRLLNPLLKLFFNPNPLIRALHLQAQLNVEAAAREAERDRRQAEWNALHYEILQRMVMEVSRLSLDLQAQAVRIDALNGRVDFNDHRVRAMEGTALAVRAAARPPEAAPLESAAGGVTLIEPAPADGALPQGEGARRRRRRRRGRRGSFGQPEGAVPAGSSPAPASEMSEIQDEPAAALVDQSPAPEASSAPAVEPVTAPEPPQPPAPEGEQTD